MGVKITAEIFCDGCRKSHVWESDKYRMGKCSMTDFVKEHYGWRVSKGKIYCRDCYATLKHTKPSR